jgi:hypothetical protein
MNTVTITMQPCNDGTAEYIAHVFADREDAQRYVLALEELHGDRPDLPPPYFFGRADGQG